MGKVAATIQKNLDSEVAAAEDDEFDVDDVPIFTPELARLKAKEAGLPMPAGTEDDAEMDADGSDDGEGGRDAYPEDFSDSEEEKEDYNKLE